MVSTFRFHDVWTIPAPSGTVFAVLADPDRYPDWWPNIVAAHRIDDETGILVCRSVLPYTLRMTVRRDLVDEPGGRLRARLEGDLAGWSSFTVTAVAHSDAAVSRVDFRQEVTAPGVPGGSHALLRPVLDANHAVMMWRGRRGLTAYLRTTAGTGLGQ